LQPRNAIAYLFFPIVGVLFNSGKIDIKNTDLNDMIKVVSDVEYYDEKGKELARKIKEKTPIIYSSTLMEPSAYRFKCGLNENAKHPAYHGVFPELCHNEIMGLAGMDRSRFLVIMIRNSDDHERVTRRMDICKEIIEERVDVEEITSLGSNIFSKIFSIIYLSDWTSYHLAVWKRVDPSPIDIIEKLKRELME